MKREFLSAAVLVLVGAIAPAQAAIVFSNFGAIPVFSNQHSVFLSSVQPIAMPFAVAPGTGFDLTQIDIGITHSSFVPGSVNAAVVQILTDVNGLPGAVVDSWVLSGLPEVNTTTLEASQQITGIAGDRLVGGARYWLVATGLSSWMAWAFPAPEVAGPFAFSPDGGTTWVLSPTGRQGGFDVLGTPVPIAQVPEPAPLALLSLGLAALATTRRRRAKPQACEMVAPLLQDKALHARGPCWEQSSPTRGKSIAFDASSAGCASWSPLRRGGSSVPVTPRPRSRQCRVCSGRDVRFHAQAAVDEHTPRSKPHMKTTLVAAAASVLALTSQAVGAAGYAFITIDPPSPFLTASASGINEAGVIAGEWTDLRNITHGFIEHGGVFVSFDAPGTDNGRVLGVAGTQALGINNAGSIVGDYTAGGTAHGFIRDASGQFTTLDLPGHVDTALVGINDNDVVAIQVDSGSAAQYRSFLRAPNGTLTSIAFPGALSTGITALDNAGITVGGYLDAASVVHGWIRNASGVYTTLTDPAYDLVGPWGLNDAGFAVGELDFAGGSHGFVRDPQGNLAAFDVPGAAFTIATDIDSLGHIVGEYCGAAGDCHGFLATPSVPEPGTLALLLAGVGVVGLRGWRAGRDRST